MERWILHVDMDAFFAAVERRDDPTLRGKPVIVGGLGRRGVVATASYEARAFGVRSAMPMAKARGLCPQAVFLSPRFERYEEVAHQVQKILVSYSPLLEPVSLDEAFLDLTGTERRHGPPEKTAMEIHRRIPAEAGLSCSVGLAGNKLLAKLASEAAKPGGVRIVRKEDVDGFLTPLSVEQLWGVGPQTARKLAARGVHTVGDLRQAGQSLLCSWFGPGLGTHLWQLAQGLDDSPVEPTQEPKSMSQEVTYPEDLYDKEAIGWELRRLALKVVDRLVGEGYLATTVRIKVRFPDFTTRTRQVRLPEATDDPVLIADEAAALLGREGLPEGMGVRLLGVGVAGLVRATFRPAHLFASPGLTEAMHKIRSRHGPQALTLGFPEQE